jgi:uncharacterized protein (TIGR03000 family)
MYSMVLMMALTGSADVPDFGRRGGCHGCRGGCYGGCYGGGWGGCYGGCRGGCWGGCYGGGYGGGGRRVAYGGYGMPAYAYGGYAMPAYAFGTPVLGTDGTMVMSPGTAYQAGYFSPGNESGMAPATIIVHLPADARLTLDGEATRSTGITRVFETPPLAPGKTFHYELVAQAGRDGEKEQAKQRIEVRAGRPTEVTLNLPTSRENRE